MSDNFDFCLGGGGFGALSEPIVSDRFALDGCFMVEEAVAGCMYQSYHNWLLNTIIDLDKPAT